MKNLIGSKSRFLTGVALVFSLLITLSGCSKSSTYNTPSGYTTGSNTGSKGGSAPGANEIWIQNMTFDPSSITVTAGTTVTWTNKDAIGHTVTSDSGLFDSGTIGVNGTYSYMFKTEGTFNYHCKIHPGMIASVTVTAAVMPGTIPGY